jgi:hypothetical protein
MVANEFQGTEVQIVNQHSVTGDASEEGHGLGAGKIIT